MTLSGFRCFPLILSLWQVVFDAFNSSYRNDKWFWCFPLILLLWQVFFYAFHSSYHHDKWFLVLSTHHIAMTSGFRCFTLDHPIAMTSNFRCFPLVLSPWQVVFMLSTHPIAVTSGFRSYICTSRLQYNAVSLYLCLILNISTHPQQKMV